MISEEPLTITSQYNEFEEGKEFMDLLIKGLEIPKEGSEVLVLWADGHVGIVEERPRRFECVAIPEHGRLIDADEFINQIVTYQNLDTCHADPNHLIYGADSVLDELNKYPTIIEASE